MMPFEEKMRKNPVRGYYCAWMMLERCLYPCQLHEPTYHNHGYKRVSLMLYGLLGHDKIGNNLSLGQLQRAGWHVRAMVLCMLASESCVRRYRSEINRVLLQSWNKLKCLFARRHSYPTTVVPQAITPISPPSHIGDQSGVRVLQGHSQQNAGRTTLAPNCLPYPVPSPHYLERACIIWRNISG